MRTGICELCLQEQRLCESHLMPRGLYRSCRTHDCDPLLITSKVMRPTSLQTKDYLLCKDCEQFLNRNGEDWVLPKLATMKGDFPFYCLLKKQEPLFAEPDAIAYAVAKNPEIDRDKLIHFALGIFWKASVHSWKEGSTAPRIDLGLQSEDLRKFLRREAGFPGNMALYLSVSPPPVGVIAFTEPVRGSNADFRNFYFYVHGMFFSLSIHNDLAEVPNWCLTNSQGLVTVRDWTPNIMAILGKTTRTAYRTKKMRETISKRERDGQRRSKL